MRPGLYDFGHMLDHSMLDSQQLFITCGTSCVQTRKYDVITVMLCPHGKISGRSTNIANICIVYHPAYLCSGTGQNPSADKIVELIVQNTDIAFEEYRLAANIAQSTENWSRLNLNTLCGQPSRDGRKNRGTKIFT